MTSAVEAGAPPSRGSSAWRDLALGTAVSLLILAAMEGGLRLAGPGWLAEPLLEPEWYEYSSRLGWTPRPGYSGIVNGAGRTFDARGFLTIDGRDLADRNRRRILAIGDSNTFGNEVDAEDAFPEVLERLLPGSAVINLGVPGYSSYQGYMTLRDRGLPLHPWLVIVSFNFNDRRYVFSAADEDGPETFRRVAAGRRLQRVLDRFATYRALRALLRKAGILGGTAGTVDVRRLVPRVPPDRYRRNLEAIVALARAHGIGVIFLALGDNPRETADLNEGLRYLRDGLEAPGRERLERAIGNDDVFSDLARVELLESLGRGGAEGTAARRIARFRPFHSLQGGRPVRTDAQYLRIMMQVAKERGVPLVDAVRVLDRNPEVYIDFCHFDRRGHATVARLLYETVRSKEPSAGR